MKLPLWTLPIAAMFLLATLGICFDLPRTPPPYTEETPKEHPLDLEMMPYRDLERKLLELIDKANPESMELQRQIVAEIDRRDLSVGLNLDIKEPLDGDDDDVPEPNDCWDEENPSPPIEGSDGMMLMPDGSFLKPDGRRFRLNYPVERICVISDMKPYIRVPCPQH